MKILGEVFYNMLNHEQETFKVSDVEIVMVQPCEIGLVDADTLEIVHEETVFVVIVGLSGERFLATKPLDDAIIANAIASKLARACEKHNRSN
jgi:hypothetical protein